MSLFQHEHGNDLNGDYFFFFRPPKSRLDFTTSLNRLTDFLPPL